jgi:hypothetical protein
MVCECQTKLSSLNRRKSEKLQRKNHIHYTGFDPGTSGLAVGSHATAPLHVSRRKVIIVFSMKLQLIFKKNPGIISKVC